MLFWIFSKIVAQLARTLYRAPICGETGYARGAGVGGGKAGLDFRTKA